jgi:putative DNA primase/helicase
VSTPLKRVLARLHNVRIAPSGRTALCPAHHDRHNSLSINEGEDGRVLLHCFAGCPPERIVAAVDLQLRDLFHLAEGETRGATRSARMPITVENLAAAKGLPSQFLRDLGLTDQGNGVLIPYRLIDGTLASRQRLRTSIVAKEGSRWLGGKGAPLPYGLWRLEAAKKAGHLTLVEGESDSWTAWFHGLPALGIPGAAMSNKLMEEHLIGISVLYILREPDKGGQTFVTGFKERLNEIRWRGDARVFRLPQGVKDLNDLHCHDAASFLKVLEAQLAAATPLNEERPHVMPLLVRMADVAPSPVMWLWKPYLPIGKLVIFEGDPGEGKTAVAIHLAATVSRGLPFPAPDGDPVQRPEAANVIYMTAEDGLADTLRPRLDRAGADVSRVYSLQAVEVQHASGSPKTRSVTLADVSAIEEALRTLRPALVIVDPLQAYLGSEMDMYRPNETRPVLAALAALAERYECVVLLIRHLTKSERENPLYRGMGSIDFAAAARSMMLATRDPRSPKRHVLVHLKSSLAALGASLAYEIGEGAAICWTGQSDLTAERVSRTRDTEEERSALDEAVEFLRELLRDGPRLVNEIFKAAKQAHIAEATLQRAKFAAKARSRKRTEVGGTRGSGSWEWYLDVDQAPASPSGEPDDHLEESDQPQEKKDVPDTVLDDQVNTLIDQPQLFDSSAVPGSVLDDQPPPTEPAGPGAPDDDSELI